MRASVVVLAVLGAAAACSERAPEKLPVPSDELDVSTVPPPPRRELAAARRPEPEPVDPDEAVRIDVASKPLFAVKSSSGSQPEHTLFVLYEEGLLVAPSSYEDVHLCLRLQRDEQLALRGLLGSDAFAALDARYSVEDATDAPFDRLYTAPRSRPHGLLIYGGLWLVGEKEPEALQELARRLFELRADDAAIPCRVGAWAVHVLRVRDPNDGAWPPSWPDPARAPSHERPGGGGTWHRFTLPDAEGARVRAARYKALGRSGEAWQVVAFYELPGVEELVASNPAP